MKDNQQPSSVLIKPCLQNNDCINFEGMKSLQNNLYNQKIRTSEEYKPKYLKKDLEGEIWKIIPDYPNYSISNLARVRNNRTNRLLKNDEHQAYTRVQFGDKKYYYLHRLVYCVFNNDYNLDGYIINHIDANKRNNNLSNLQKIAQQENYLKQKRFND